MNINPTFIVKTSKGYYCAEGDFYLDPRQAVPNAIVSHAHADHAVAGSEHVYCTKATAAIMQLRLGDKAAKHFHIHDDTSNFNLGNIDISFFPAGHIIGSVMVLMKKDNVKYLYTGDFKLQCDPTCSSIQITQADVLITETTFAHPKYSHPETTRAIEELVGKNHSKITIGAYAVGKAQHITHLLQKHNEYKVFIHPKIIPIHHLYEQHGVKLGNWKPYNRTEFRNAQKAVFIVPPTIYYHLPRRYTDLLVFATGWEQRSQGKEHLHISDHADWEQLMRFIKEVDPKIIFTIHGDGDHLADHMKHSPIKVMPLHVKRKNNELLAASCSD